MTTIHDPTSRAVASATFGATAGNSIRLYHDASADATGSAGAFADIAAAIRGARHFVFITDWSFHPDVAMDRSASPVTIGELLLRQANAHPDMLIAVMPWRQVASVTGDHDNNSALAALERRSRALGFGQVPTNLVWRASPYGRTNTFSHHQKFVVADTDAGGGRIGAVGFFGGLDLTRGRFDWGDHPLGPTPPQAFAHDWYNGEFAHDPDQIREPWHDIHARIEGPAAWHLADEFTARWAAPGQYSTLSVAGPLGDNTPATRVRVLRHRTRLDTIRAPDPDPARGGSSQLLHSINRDAWTVPAPAEGCGDRFTWRLPTSSERSIQDGYLQMIGSAERFIYLESQYFIGSGSQWGLTRYGGARATVENEVPRALVDRILDRWRAGHRFHVYLVLPMFPEGSPADTGLRAVRYLQWCTIEYVVNALHQAMAGDPTADWRDWFSVYFLANWGRSLGSLPAGTTGDERFDNVRTSRRYMTYVHSKAMIVDDEAGIIGSANLNERSLNGDRDSEVAMALWGDGIAGELAELRRALFTEHLGAEWMGTVPATSSHQLGDLPPEDPLVVSNVRSAADRTFENFMNNTGSVHDGRLARWPLETDGRRLRFTCPAVTEPDVIPDAPSTRRAHWTWLSDWSAVSQLPLGGRLFE